MQLFSQINASQALLGNLLHKLIGACPVCFCDQGVDAQKPWLTPGGELNEGALSRCLDSVNAKCGPTMGSLLVCLYHSLQCTDPQDVAQVGCCAALSRLQVPCIVRGGQQGKTEGICFCTTLLGPPSTSSCPKLFWLACPVLMSLLLCHTSLLGRFFFVLQ